MKENITKKVALYGILGALALTLSLFENILIPDIPFLPAGAKPGLSNVVTMFTAYFCSLSGAFYITLLKAVFALLTRGATAFLMSLFGGILSTAVLCICVRFIGKNLSFIGVGVLCAAFHNLGQVICACFTVGTPLILNYYKYLLIFAVISGFLTGVVLNVLELRAESVLKKLKIK